jgi:hypothetical protein
MHKNSSLNCNQYFIVPGILSAVSDEGRSPDLSPEFRVSLCYILNTAVGITHLILFLRSRFSSSTSYTLYMTRYSVHYLLYLHTMHMLWVGGRPQFFYIYSLVVCKRTSSVGIALGYGLDDRGSRVRFPAGLGIFLFTTASRTALGPTQPPIQWVPGALSHGVKRSGREADHSPPSSAEFKEWMELYLHSPNTP